MNLAKLRRSRDVSENHTSQIGKRLRFSRLAVFNMAFLAAPEKDESVAKRLDPSTQSRAFQWSRSKHSPHIFSGRQSLLRQQTGGIL
jgi:hypothetical protein